jgi:hypothetical protein
VSNVLLAPLAKLAHLQAVLERFLVLVRVIIDAFALTALQFDHVVL